MDVNCEAKLIANTISQSLSSISSLDSETIELILIKHLLQIESEHVEELHNSNLEALVMKSKIIGGFNVLTDKIERTEQNKLALREMLTIIDKL